MAHLGRRAALAVLATLIGVSSAQAYWVRYYCCCPMPSYPSYGYPSGYAYGPNIQVRPVPREPGLATPKPAPPSSTEPPLGSPPKRAPIITEARSMGGKYVAGKQPVGERVLVGFWNLTGREVMLRVNGQSHVVGKDKAINLEMKRSFVWQVDQGEPTAELVQDKLRRHEVLMRP